MDFKKDLNELRILGGVELAEEKQLERGSVGHFIMVISSRITQWDMKESSKRGYNMYALSLMLGQVPKIEKDMKGRKYSTDPEDMKRLKQSIERHFTKMRWRDRVLRDIDKFVDTGKTPKLR